MNLRHLEHLLAVADTGSFSRAAEKEHITQSALSRSIQVLENDIGGKLLDRFGKHNELTPLGLQVVERARHVVYEALQLRQSSALLQSGGLGSVRVGLGSGPGALLMIPLICYMAENYPAVHLGITRGPTELQLVQIRARQLDALVVDMRRVVPAPDLNIEAIMRLRGGFVCRADHPLAKRKTVSLNDVRAFPVGSTPLSEDVARSMVDLYGPEANPSQMVTLQCEDIASLIAATEKTQTVYMGVLAAAREGLATGRLVELKIQPTLEITARFAYITLKGRTEAPVMAVLRRFVIEHLHD
jgi:DNA-binding transcriptional LysR family regulator